MNINDDFEEDFEEQLYLEALYEAQDTEMHWTEKAKVRLENKKRQQWLMAKNLETTT